MALFIFILLTSLPLIWATVGTVRAMRRWRAVPAPVDPRKFLREMRQREMAEWEADFRRLSGVPDPIRWTGTTYDGPRDGVAGPATRMAVFQRQQAASRFPHWPYTGPIDGIEGAALREAEAKQRRLIQILGIEAELAAEWPDPAPALRVC